MDGVLLVFDSRTLPNLHALAPVEVPVEAPRAHWRHRTFPAMAALILASVFSLVYFVSIQRSVPSDTPVSGASVTAPLVDPVAPSDSNQIQAPPATEASSASVSETPKEEVKPEATHKAASTTPPAPVPEKKASTKSTSTTQSRPAEEPKKDDSKVGSILKKTGRILKKPFKF
jgi:hypothetical protein